MVVEYEGIETPAKQITLPTWQSRYATYKERSRLLDHRESMFLQ